MLTKTVLIVDDNPEYVLFLQALLHTECQMLSVATIAEARNMLVLYRPDLILLDVGFQKESGFEFCTELKSTEKNRNIPILFLTSRDATHDKVTGFSLGAEDYVAKSLDPLEIQARIRNVLNRIANVSSLDFIEKNGIKIDFSLQRAYLLEESKSQELVLTPTEFKILSYLMRNEGKIFSRQKLLDEIWGNRLSISGRTVDTHVHSLRKKMGSQARKIESVFGAGYRFNPRGEV